ncbi:MAG: DNA replication/repair protein RecF [Actinomycetota bacterium]
MRVGTLALEDFRNYETLAVEFVDGLNLVVGRNAQGKTNLLEAVYCLSGLGSPRSPDAALIRQGEDRSLLHARVTRRARTFDVDIELKPGRGTRALINKTAIPSGRALADLSVSVFFGPDELSLVKGSPDGRRRFLDDLIVKLRPSQEDLRREWERVLKQRNALLKSLPRRGGERVLPPTMDVWDEAFCRAAAQLATARLRALAALVPYAQRRYMEVAGGGLLALTYVSSWVGEDLVRRAVAAPDDIDVAELRTALAARIDEVRPREMERGISLAGPGRDDVGVRLAGGSGELLDARTFASQGDQRTAALALKLAEHDLLSEVLNDPPILLLDDVFSELDPRRRDWLREAVRAAGQTILSSADTDAWSSLGAERVFSVEQGKVELVE